MPKLDGATQYTMALAAAGKAVTPVGAPATMAAGTLLLVVVPFPSWPEALLPQQ
jgi:hypothetical protein